MKLALCLLLAYMMTDAGLTMAGLNLGLHEGNLRAMSGIIPHVLLVALSLAAFAMEKYLNLKHITRTAILLLTGFYIYVLIHNLYVIWRYA